MLQRKKKVSKANKEDTKMVSLPVFDQLEIEKPKNHTGPKPKYRKFSQEQITSLAKLGATNGQIAEFFGVGENTIDNWIKYYPDFSIPYKAGKMEADLKVTEALYKRATGYEYQEEVVVSTRMGLRKLKVTKQVLPSEKAIFFWLSNRQRELWANALHIKHQGSVNHNVRNLDDIPVKDLSPQTQEMLFELTQKQISIGPREN